MKHILACALLLFALQRAAIARLWESPAQMAERLGEPREDWLEFAPFGEIEGCTLKAYMKDDIVVFAYFKDEKNVCECYQKQGEPFSLAQIDGLLEANAFSKPWRPITDAKEPAWAKKDHSATARYMGRPASLIVTTPRFDDLMKDADAAKASKDKRSVAGF